MTEPVRYERVGAAAVLTIDRQERRNAVDGPTAEKLLEGFRAFEADDDARVLVVCGEGGVSFCAGADLKAIDSFAGRLEAPEGPFGFTRLTASKPTIAAISRRRLPGRARARGARCAAGVARGRPGGSRGVGPAPRPRGLDARLPGPPLGRAAHRRRDAATAADRSTAAR